MISSKLKKLKEMKFIKSIGLLTLFALLALSSCRKDKITEDDQIINPEPAVFFNGSISGVIVDESEEGVPNAEVTFGTNSMTTDENGYFLFKNVSINEKGSLVTAEKEGYFYNAKFVGSRLNKTNYTKIKMIEKVLSGSFEATLGGAVSTNGGANVQFNNNSIKTEGGGLYAGTVNVYATWLDPTANDLGQRAPGDLRAMNTADEQVQLTTYGMIGVELEAGIAIVFAIAFGIAVDDTIHFLSKYKLERDKGKSREDALHTTFKETGKAIILTSIILFFGFLVLFFSIHPPSRAIGLLIAVTLISALVADLYLIPVLIRYLTRNSEDD